MKDDTLKKYSRGVAKKGQSASKESHDMEFLMMTLENRSIPLIPFVSVFKNLWTAFLAIVWSSVVCFILGFLPFANLDKQTNWFSVIFSVGIVLAVRHGMITASNRKLHRKFAFAYGLAWALISFLSLRNFQLGIFDIRPLIHSLIDLPSIVVDGILSIFVAIMASSLSTSMLYELFARKSMSAIIPSVMKFETISRWFISLSDKQLRLWKFLYNVGGLLPIVTFFAMKLASKYVAVDEIIIIVFCVLELIVSLCKLALVHMKVQFCTHSSLSAAVAFNSNRSVESGRMAHVCLKRSMRMIAVAATALSLQPMMIVMAVCGVVCSFVMRGALMVAVRHACLFVIGFSDLSMMGYRVVGMFVGYDN